MNENMKETLQGNRNRREAFLLGAQMMHLDWFEVQISYPVLCLEPVTLHSAPSVQGGPPCSEHPLPAPQGGDFLYVPPWALGPEYYRYGGYFILIELIGCRNENYLSGRMGTISKEII